MPELPEVETIKNTVSPFMNGATIKKVTIRQKQLREPIPDDFATRTEGAKIIGLRRIAKYMLVDLANGQTIIWHFGMSGKLRIEKTLPAELQKHDHLIMETDRGFFIYNDTRRFGLITLCRTADLPQHKLFCNLGFDPWDKGLDSAYLLQKFHRLKTPVKVALLNQEIICGIGNIYASEILYKARIRPDRPAESITAAESQKIITCTQEILSQAIKAGGSTIHDYKRPDGDIGYFQNMHCVYNKTGQRCPDCRCNIDSTGGIQKSVIGGRSAFYCNTLQK
jgi:formamidopyrimidine-DNA glycosylase